jgi:hypothetical protein
MLIKALLIKALFNLPFYRQKKRTAMGPFFVQSLHYYVSYSETPKRSATSM